MCHHAQSQSVRFFYDNWESAIKQAKKENKMVFIDSYAKWCVPCKKMEPVFRNSELSKYFNEHFVNVKVNMDNPPGRKLYQLYDVIFLPTVLIMDGHGNVRYRSDRVMTAPELLDAARHAVNPTYTRADRTAPAAYHNSTPGTTYTKSEPATTYTKATTKAPSSTTRTTRSSSSTARTTKSSSSTRTTVRPSPETAKKYAHPESIVKEEPGEKVLYVLDGNSNPNDPSFLKQEAYFRLQLGDGSHKAKAKAYLASQKDWSTPENMKFILDFLADIESDESLYLIVNRKKFEAEFGQDKIMKNFEFLVYTKLNQGYPRPTLQQSQAYYSYLDPRTSKRKAHRYFLLRLYEELNYEEFMSLSDTYLEDMNPNDDEIMYTKALVIDSLSLDKNSLKQSIKLLEKANDINKVNYDYKYTLAKLYDKNGNKKKAMKTAQGAIQVAKMKNLDYSATEELLALIEK